MHPKLGQIAFILLVIFSSCQYGEPSRVETPADSASGSIPFELEGMGGAALVVPVYLNGTGPYSFVLDTGATLTCVDHTLVDSLSLPEATGKIGFGGTVSGSGQMRLVTIDSLRIGSAKAFDLTTCSLDLEHLEQGGLDIDGLLGLNFLKSFHLTLDFERTMLTLKEP